MTQHSSEISYYVDCMIIETLAANPELVKKADMVGALDSLVNSIKSYVDQKIDPNDKVGSIINLLAPGKVFATFSLIGHPWIGALIGLAISAFDIDIAGILRKIYYEVRSLISGGKKTNKAEVDAAVTKAVASEFKPATEKDEEEAIQNLTNRSFGQDMRAARIVKLAMESYQNGIIKDAGIFQAGFFAVRGKLFKILKYVFSLIWQTFLASAGFMVAGDVIRDEKPAPPGSGGWFDKKEPSGGLSRSRQTVFKQNPSYSPVAHNSSNEITWSIKAQNDKNGIGTMLINFAKEVYDGLDGLDNIIAATAGFRVIASKIYWYNYSRKGSNIVYIPRIFKTKKDIVDMFIDDVARQAPKTAK